MAGSAATVERPEAPLAARVAACSLAYGPNDDRRCWWCGDRVPAGRYEWCSQGCEATWEDAHVWPRARRAAIRRAAHRCRWCPSRDVEVHHDPPVGDLGYGPGCQHHPDYLAVLCPDHHRAEHRRTTRVRPGRQMVLFNAA